MTGGALGAVRLIEKEKERKQDGVVYLYICNHFTDHKIQGYINLTNGPMVAAGGAFVC